MTDLLVQYEADKGSLRRFYFIDYSPERTERLKVFSKDYQQQLSAVNFESLSAGSRVDYILLRRDLQEELRKLDEESTQYKQLTNWFPLADKIYQAEKERR